MHKKTLAILSLFLLLSLTGCLEISQEIWHNPDGSGRVTFEMILSEDMLSFMGIEGDIEENREEILKELEISPEDLPTDDPNVRNVAIDSYYDQDQAKFHIVMNIELVDLSQGLPLDEGEDMGGFEFTITQNEDGTFRFSQKTEASTDLGGGELDDASLSMFTTFMEGDLYTLKLHIEELVEADPRAVYDKANDVIVWEIPMIELISSSEPLEFWAVYRTKSSSFLPALDIGGLPGWVPPVLLGLCCLSLVIIIIIVIVVVLVARKRKKNAGASTIPPTETLPD